MAMSRSPDRVLLSRLVDTDYADPGRGQGQKYNYKSPILPELPRRAYCQTVPMRRIIDSILRSNGPGGGEVERHQLFHTVRIDRSPDDCEYILRGPSTASCHGAIPREDIMEDDHVRQQFQDLLAAQVAVPMGNHRLRADDQYTSISWSAPRYPTSRRACSGSSEPMPGAGEAVQGVLRVPNPIVNRSSSPSLRPGTSSDDGLLHQKRLYNTRLTLCTCRSRPVSGIEGTSVSPHEATTNVRFIFS